MRAEFEQAWRIGYELVDPRRPEAGWKHVGPQDLTEPEQQPGRNPTREGRPPHGHHREDPQGAA